MQSPKGVKGEKGYKGDRGPRVWRRIGEWLSKQVVIRKNICVPQGDEGFGGSAGEQGVKGFRVSHQKKQWWATCLLYNDSVATLSSSHSCIFVLLIPQSIWQVLAWHYFSSRYPTSSRVHPVQAVQLGWWELWVQKETLESGVEKETSDHEVQRSVTRYLCRYDRMPWMCNHPVVCGCLIIPWFVDVQGEKGSTGSNGMQGPPGPAVSCSAVPASD